MDWKIFQMNEFDWWVARSMEEARESYQSETGADPELFEGARELNASEMANLTIKDDGHNPLDWSQWQCECGAVGDSNCRWNGFAYEHPHPYPIGHVEMKCMTRRSYAEELERMIADGAVKVGLFATTEF